MPSYWLPIDDPASAQYDAQVMAVLKDIKSLSSRVPAWPLDTGTSTANGMTSQKWLSYRALLWNVIRYYLKPGTTDWQAVLLPVTVPVTPFPYTMVFDAAMTSILQNRIDTSGDFRALGAINKDGMSISKRPEHDL